ncbi:MAG: Gfo/Idh/MocA family oxidoreductase [Balneolales bacterium]|nr:Gfo/Idh/MocA family oxidoreductase [Balneolales bacterium]
MREKRFALTGVAGYIAPRHLQAIYDTGNKLVAAMDPFDSVGILDRYFPQASFFTEFERYDRHLEKLRRVGDGARIDYISICSPNYLHDAHIRQALRIGAHAICEKPLVLNPWNLDALQEMEEETDAKVFNVLQLRTHPRLLALKEKVDKEKIENPGKRYRIKLQYITSRGLWYKHSWKGSMEKSGGVATNIGIHFFDMLIWMFGNVDNCRVLESSSDTISGELELKNADVEWILSIDPANLPPQVIDKDIKTYRLITVDEDEIEFSGGFVDLHTRVYEETLQGRGFTMADARPSIELVYRLRNMPVQSNIIV